MTIPDESLVIIEKLIQFEERLQALYSEYAREYPELTKFWHQLAEEEGEHAAVMRRARQAVADGRLTVTAGRTSTGVLDAFLQYATNYVTAAKRGDMPLHMSIAEALDLEDTMMEKNFPGYFTGDEAVIREMTQALTGGTSDHIARLRELQNRTREQDIKWRDDSPGGMGKLR